MSRVVVAFDSFKGSIDAAAACEAAARGIRAAVPGTDVAEVPMADGGEGSLELLERTSGAHRIRIETTDAIGRPIVADALLDGARAWIEIASACGLPHVSDAPLRPLEATTAGVGALIARALDLGARDLTLFLGGSATTDGGAGVLRALGARLLDAHGAPLGEGGGALRDLETLEVTGLDPRALEASWTFVSDVDAPLTGPSGAAAVFGPQKGATPDDVEALDAGLSRLAHVAASALGVDAAHIDDVAGAGAAGGFAAVLLPALGGRMVAGSRWFADRAGLDEALAGASLVITGEGRFDAQSLGGKVFSEVARAAGIARARVVVLAGSLDDAGLDAAPVAAFSIATGPATLDELRTSTSERIERAAGAIARLALG